MKYYLIGPYPPPLGGVSVFIKRFSRLLEERGQKAVVVDFSKRSKAARLAQLIRLTVDPAAATFHLNAFDAPLMLALIARPWACRIIYQDHSDRMLERLSTSKKSIFRRFLRKVDEVKFISPQIKAFYDRAGFVIPEGKLTVEPAFIPPPLDEEEAILRTYDDETLSFVATHSPLVVANAYKITFHDGIDLYGIDMCIELALELKNVFPNAGVVFALADVGDNDYFAEANRRIESKGLRDSFMFMTGQRELWPLLKKADLMVRPTSTDGYGISIAEALHLGCPAVASDVCDRPAGTVLFKSRDMADFTAKVLAALKARGCG